MRGEVLYVAPVRFLCGNCFFRVQRELQVVESVARGSLFGRKGGCAFVRAVDLSLSPLAHQIRGVSGVRGERNCNYSGEIRRGVGRRRDEKYNYRRIGVCVQCPEFRKVRADVSTDERLYVDALQRSGETLQAVVNRKNETHGQ